MSRLFNEKMTYPEAQQAFFSAVRGKTAEESAEIISEYKKVVSVITERELSEFDGWLTSYPL